ncbi:hypothetical protein BDQ17DRAFT_541495 [Cyathus striatus]|nr:hypothetical protein BDQ17DRAFT_541495 [Cyathus striatus]
MLGLFHGTQAIKSSVQASGNLRKYGTLSSEDLYYTISAARNLMFTGSASTDYIISFAFPVWVQYFQSYKNDALVKQLLILSSFRNWNFEIPISYMHQLVQDAGYITSPDADQATTLLLEVIKLSRWYGGDIRKFLSYSKYSGPFHCTRDEYVGTVCHALTAFRRLCDIEHLKIFLEEWTNVLGQTFYESRLFNMEHPLLLKSLKSEARAFHNIDAFNQKLTHKMQHHLFSWFKKLQCPPRGIMDLWQKAFEKARHSTLEGTTGYSYFCDISIYCKTCQLQLNHVAGNS